MELFVNCKDGAGFVLLITATRSEYTDKTPLLDKDAAVWEYSGVYKKDDERVGEFSDPVSITVAKQVVAA